MLKKEMLLSVFCHVGALIVYIGLVLFLGQHWHSLSHSLRFIDTLGSAIVAYFLGIFLSRYAKTEALGSSLSLMAALFFPVGISVFYHRHHLDTVNFFSGMSLHHLMMISAVSFSIYFISFLMIRKNVYLIFSIIFATWFSWNVWNDFIRVPLAMGADGYYLVFLGLIYILLASLFSRRPNRAVLSGTLYGFGILFFLSGGFFEYVNALSHAHNLLFLWQFIYPVMLFIALFLSVHLNRKVFLVFGVLFLIAYILSFAERCFLNSLGLPLLLVLIGLGVIVVSALVILIQRKMASGNDDE